MRRAAAMLLLAVSGFAEEPAEGYFSGIRVLRAEDFFDLDTGGVFPRERPYPGGRAEFARGGFLVATVADAAFADAAAPGVNLPWQRVLTNAGNTSWVQLLRSGDASIVRFVTRVGGAGPPLPAPRRAFAVGRKDRIELHFQPDERYARYRVEREVVLGEPRALRADAAASPFVDGDVRAGERYAYLVRGVTAAGDAGIAYPVQADVTSAGVRSGRIPARQGRGMDLFAGRGGVARGDLLVVGASGRTLTLHDAYGAPVVGTDAQVRAVSVWEHRVVQLGRAEFERPFVVPLRGGGIARGRVVSIDPKGSPVVEYDLTGDGFTLPPAPRLHAERTDDGVRILVESPADYPVATVTARGLLAAGAGVALPVVDGVALDRDAVAGDVRDYFAQGADRHGRLSLPARARVSLLDGGVRVGEMTLANDKGFSLERGQEAPAEEADVWMERSRTSYTYLRATRGLRSLRRILNVRVAPREALFDTVRRVDPAQITLIARERGRSREASSDLFIVRTRNGGWAKLVVLDRSVRGQARLRYVWNPVEPVFGPLDGVAETRGGVSLIGLDRVLAPQRIRQAWQQGHARLSSDAAFRALFEPPQTAGGMIPGDKGRQEVLWSLVRHGKPELATFDFVRGSRGGADLFFDRTAGQFEVRPSKDGQSRIAFLGHIHWRDLAGRKRLEPRYRDRAVVGVGNLYLIQTLREKRDFRTLLLVTAYRPGDRVAFEWASAQSGRLTHSPGLRMAGGLGEHLLALLRRGGVDPEATPRSRALRARLAQVRVTIGLRETPASDFLRDFGALVGVQCELPEAAQATPLSFFVANATVAELLDEAARQLRCTWDSPADDRVRFVPRSG